MPNWLNVYHALPYQIRVIAASLHGYYLNSIRYSADTVRLITEAHERDQWTSEEWQSRQSEQVANMLEYAAESIPYYRQHWSERRRHGDRASVNLIKNWPILHKDSVRDQPYAFIADGTNIRDQMVEHTSGTTGKPLTFWMSRDSVRQWYALFEARWRGWYGFSRHDRWGILGGQLVVPYRQARAPFWVWNAGMHQLYLSSYHLASQNTAAYIKAIEKHQLVYLLGYASSLYSLAQMAIEQKLDIPKLKAVISNAEPLYVHQREVISRAFQCSVYDTYGLSENVCAASECLQGHLHLWPEVGVTEIMDDRVDEMAQPGETGRLICTGLFNKTMPLIRYEVGDRASLFPDSYICGCRRQMPILGGIEGRQDDVIVTRDGRRIGRLDPVFKADLPIREAQIIQEDLNDLQVLYVPAVGFSIADRDVFLERLRARVGDMRIIFQEVDQIPRTSNGKFRAVISKLK
jgi:phenylacetate-CoA ligase